MLKQIGKYEVATQISEILGIERRVAYKYITSIISIIKSEFEKGQDVKIKNFGQWKIKHKNKRRAHNPKSKEIHYIPARTVVVFRLSPYFRKKLNPKEESHANSENEKSSAA